MTIYDITIPISPTLAVWPGDTLYTFELGMAIQNGNSVNVGAVTMSTHTGTHADAPFHFSDRGESIGALSLEAYIGPAIVIDVTGYKTIGPEVFANKKLSDAPRVLLKTNTWENHSLFPKTVPTLTEEAATYLGEQGILLFGIDVPSVDAIDSKTLPIHHTLNAANIRILESLNLRNVPSGVYELIALPLPLTDGDGSPVRAILRSSTVE